MLAVNGSRQDEREKANRKVRETAARRRNRRAPDPDAVRRVVGAPTADSDRRRRRRPSCAPTTELQKHHENCVYREARREYYVGAPHESRVEIVPSGFISAHCGCHAAARSAPLAVSTSITTTIKLIIIIMLDIII